MRIITFLIYSVCISLVFLSIISSPFSNRMAQGRVYQQNVSCIKTGLHENVPGGTLSGSQAFDIINQANSLAIELARQAESTLFVLPTIEPGSADPTTVATLQNRFGLGITNPADLQLIPKLEFEYKQVIDYLDGGYTLYICLDPECEQGDDAFTEPSGGTDVENHTIHLCSDFWNSHVSDASDQAGTILHEAFHIHWHQVNDKLICTDGTELDAEGNCANGLPPRTTPQVHNAHCFEQFALDLKGMRINPNFEDMCAASAAGGVAQGGGLGENTGVPECDPAVDANCSLAGGEVAQGGRLGENTGVPECDPAVDANCPLASSNETVADSTGDTSPPIESGEFG